MIKTVIKIELIPVNLTAISVNSKSEKLYKKIITLLKYIFFVFINNKEQIKDRTGM